MINFVDELWSYIPSSLGMLLNLVRYVLCEILEVIGETLFAIIGRRVCQGVGGVFRWKCIV